MGGLCSKDEPGTFDNVKSGNHAGPKQNANNHVTAGEQPDTETQLLSSELIALKTQLQQLQDRNTSLQRELVAARDAARSNAELQSKLRELQTEHDGLQREYTSTQQQLAGSGQQAEARAEAERKLAEVQKQYTELKSMNNQLRRRVSDLATGHAEPPLAGPAAEEQPASPAEERCREVLSKVRDSNPGSKISVAFWRSSDFKRWQGVRSQNGEVTGLALSSMQLTVLPPEIGQLSRLTALLLSNNGLIQLPATLGQLTGLTSLMLDGNNLKELPAELCDLIQLQTLWLHDNQLGSLPHAMGKLTNLRQLIANDNALEQLPQSIGELKGLTSLWLDNNKLTDLPETFSQLTELKRLRVDSALARLVPEQLRGNGTTGQSVVPRFTSVPAGVEAAGSSSGAEADEDAPASTAQRPAVQEQETAAGAPSLQQQSQQGNLLVESQERRESGPVAAQAPADTSDASAGADDERGAGPVDGNPGVTSEAPGRGSGESTTAPGSPRRTGVGRSGPPGVEPLGGQGALESTTAA